MTKPPVTPLEYAMRLLSVKPHSEYELLQKLKKKNFSGLQIQQTVQECRRYGYLNDELFAEDYAQLLTARGHGRRFIIQKLKMLRIPENTIENAIGKITGFEDEAQKVFDFKLRMLKNEPDSQKKKQKLYRFMLGRGYDYELIKKFLAQI